MLGEYGFHQLVFDGVEFLPQTPRLAQCAAPGDIDYADGHLQITMQEGAVKIWHGGKTLRGLR